MPHYLRRHRPHLEMRHRCYLAVMEIPKPLRPKLGRARFVKSLETDSVAIAERRAAPLIEQWRREIAEARDDDLDAVTSPLYWPDARQQAADAAFFRRALRDARTEQEREAVRDRASDLAYDIGMMHMGDADESPTDRPEAAAFYSSATDLTFDDYLAEWLAASRVTAKTKDMQAADVRRFTAAFPTVAAVTKPAVKRWVSGLIAGGLTPKTMQRILSALRGYWRHLQSIEVASEALEPFYKLNLPTQGGRVQRDDKRQPFTAAHVTGLLAEAQKRDDDELVNLIEMARYTGARIEELCSLRIENVHLGAKVPYLAIVAGKTDAAIREVPVHPRLLPVLRHMIDGRTAGFVLAGRTANKYDSRGGAIGTKFGRMKKRMGFGRQFVFHSLRKTVATILKDAGVPEATTADIMGHDIPTMSYGVYAGNVSLATKATAIKKLHYPAPARTQ
jgi:integrase